MQHRNQQQESHLPEILRLLSTYHALSLLQLEALYPELPQQKLLLLLKKLEKTGRLTLVPERNLVLHTGDSVPNPSTLAAFWVLLDFREDITYHTASDFPVTLTFYTQSDAYDIPGQEGAIVPAGNLEPPEDALQYGVTSLLPFP